MCSGRLAPGDRIPETQIAEHLSISRTPVREALRILEAQGLLRSLRGIGFEVRGLSLHQLDALYETRALLESHGAALAAERAADEDLWGLREALERSAPKPVPESGEGRAKALASAAASNIRFHEKLAELSANEYLASFVRQLAARPLQHRGVYWYTPEQRQRVHAEHVEIFAALQRRDASQAAELMQEHTVWTAKFMRRTLSAHPELLD